MLGGITGSLGWDSSVYGTITNSYYKKGTATYSHYKISTTYTTGITESATLQGYASTLGNAFTNDVKIKVINKETGLEEEVWSNGGYPILKWQIGE